MVVNKFIPVIVWTVFVRRGPGPLVYCHNDHAEHVADVGVANAADVVVILLPESEANVWEEARNGGTERDAVLQQVNAALAGLQITFA